MPDDKKRDKEMEALSKAIVEAIMKSADVKEALGKVLNRENLRDSSFMALLLKIENLTQSMGLEISCSCEFEGEELVAEDTAGSDKQLLSENIEEDAKLSPQEKAFREFLADRFDEDEWLKKHGLIL